MDEIERDLWRERARELAEIILRADRMVGLTGNAIEYAKMVLEMYGEEKKK